MWFYVAAAVDWTALQGTHSFSLFKLYSPHCNLQPIWTSPTTHLSLQKDDWNSQNGRKGINRKKVSCLLPVAWPYKQVNTGTEEKEERWPHRAEQETASLQHCPVISLNHTKYNLNPLAYINFSGFHPKNTTPHHITSLQNPVHSQDFWTPLTILTHQDWGEVCTAGWTSSTAYTGENLEAIPPNHFHTRVRAEGNAG